VNKDISQLATKFDKLAQQTQPAATDAGLIDSISNALQHAAQSLATDAAHVAEFQRAMAPLLQARRNWNALSPQNKLQIITSVFQQYTSLPQNYMDPNNFKPVALRDNISRLFSKLVSQYRG